MDVRETMTLVEPLLEMAIKRKHLIEEVRNLRRQITDHAFKLVLVHRPHNDIQKWKTEIATWLDDIASMRVKRGNKPLKVGEYFDLLFGEQFIGTQYAHVIARRIASAGYLLDSSASVQNAEQKTEALCRTFDTWAATAPDMSNTTQVRATLQNMLAPF